MKKYLNLVVLVLLLGLPLGLAQEQTEQQAQTEGNTITDIVVQSGDFDRLEEAVVAANLAEVLSGEGPFTVFAPNDAAFARIAPGDLETLLAADDIGTLRNILLYHVVQGEALTSDQLSGMDTVTTIATDDTESALTVRQDVGTLYVNNARVIEADIQASNGVIHVIDIVLDPPVPPTLGDPALNTAFPDDESDTDSDGGDGSNEEDSSEDDSSEDSQ